MSQAETKNKSEVSLPSHDFDSYIPEPGEIYMNDKQLKHFYNILTNWKQKLMEAVDKTVHLMQDETQNAADPADRATQEEEFSLQLRARDRERKLIKKIEQTIMLIENKDYGFCDNCGEEIGIKRLEARPTANMCIECKTLDEIREKHRAE